MKKSLQFLLSTILFSGICIDAVSENINDIIIIEGAKYKILSDNIIPNSGFEEGFSGWTDGTTSSAQLSSTSFKLVSTGGLNNSQYLVGTINSGSATAGSIGTGWSINGDKKYLFYYHVKYISSTAVAGLEEWLKISLTNNKNSNLEPKILIDKTEVLSGGEWTKNSIVFENTAPSYSYLMARFRWLDNRFGFDEFALYEVSELPNIEALQETIEEAELLYNAELTGAQDLLQAIELAKEFLQSDSPSDVLKAIDDLKDSITKFKYNSASSDNPVDMTSFIINQGFDENTGVGWKGIGVINYHEVEFYEKLYDMYQDIKGLPAGKYRLKTQGFERPKANDSGVAYKNGTEKIYSVFYAKSTNFPEKTVPFSSLYKHRYTGTGSLNGYINSMQGAEIFFKRDVINYENIVEDIIVEDGDILRIGARTEFKQSGYWVLFDNFRLEYLGKYDNADLITSINEYIEKSGSILENKMQKAKQEELENAILHAKSIISETTVDNDILSNAYLRLNNAIKDAQLSVTSYIDLEAAIKEGYEYYEIFTGTKAKNLLTAINTAEFLIDNLDAEYSSIVNAIGGINKLIIKKIHIPTWMMGDVNNPNNNWSMERSIESKNWILFWEPGYGQDPSVVVDGGYRIDTKSLLDIADKCFYFYADSLKFINRGESKTDDYKMIIRLRYTRDWEATGSGVDDTIGLLTLTAWSAQAAGHTLAHEVGHCFQYQVHCDNNNQNGWMYGFGDNASGGNGWWEMCAQWQGFKIYPNQQFTDGRFNNYMNTAHKHPLHETPRYDNYFIQDFWTYKHGMDMIGRLWNESKRPEDPIETYKRITGLTQSQFNDEMFECAARFATWDIPALKSNGASKISSRPQPKLNDVGNNVFRIDASVCPENYGYNIIKLNVPKSEQTVTAFFTGKAGLTGYRKKNVTSAGWRYGFVALKNDGTRVYSDIGSVIRTNSDTLKFDCPENCKNLWLIVTGAPTTYWRHAWDDNDANDEQWPYEVSFLDTNILGKTNITGVENVVNDNYSINIVGNEIKIENLNENSLISIYDISGRLRIKEIGRAHV